jgi:hypothetical protein
MTKTTTKTWAQSLNDALDANLKAHGPGVIIGKLRNDT